MTRRIPVKTLSGDSVVFAWVDDEDYVEQSRWSWRQDGGGYAVRRLYAGKVNGRHKYRTIWMHREILDLDPLQRADHVDRNKLNNCRHNLRLATQAENVRNTPGRKTMHGKPCSSVYKGVTWDKKRRKWLAVISVDKRQRTLGAFTDEVSAAHAYDEASRRLHNHFGYLNFPEATAAENRTRSARGRVQQRQQTSSLRNVHWNQQRQKWVVMMSVNNKTTYIGRFDDIKDAEDAAIEARKQYRQS